MKFIDQLKNFGEQSAGVLDAKEQAMYLRLFLIANKLGWPEWFAVSRSQLMRELNIKHAHTITLAKNALEKSGFVETRRNGRTGTTIYRIVPLTRSKNDRESKNDLMEGDARSKNDLAKVKNCPSFRSKNDHIKDDKTLQDNIAAAASPDFAEIANFFSNNIHPIAGEVEMQKLASFLDDYGKDWTLAAIEEAAESNGRSVKYIGSILERWKRDGFKSDRKGKRYGRSIPGGARPSAAEKMRAEQAKWDAQTSGWE